MKASAILKEFSNIAHSVNLKHGAILYNEAEVFSLSITNPNGRPMLPFDWLIHSSVILVSCHRILFFHVPVFCGREINLKTKIRKELQTAKVIYFIYGNVFFFFSQLSKRDFVRSTLASVVLLQPKFS